MPYSPREHDIHRSDEDGYISTINPLHAHAQTDEGRNVTERVNKLKEERISDADKRQRYKRGSIVDRYRRASIFDEIVSQMVENQPKDQGQNSNVRHTKNGSREKRIQHIQASGVSQDHRARLIAFELAAKQVMEEEAQKHTDNSDYPYSDKKNSALGGETWYFNPYSVASMPEDIRKGFLLKVFGILMMQIMVMIATIAIVKYTIVGNLLLNGYVFLVIYFLTFILLFVLMFVRQRHPTNLIVFSMFTVSLSSMIGLVFYTLTDRIFFVTMIGLLVMLTAIMWFCNRSLDDFTFCKTFGVVFSCATATSLVSGIFFKANYWHSHLWPGVTTMLFGTWIIWDIVAIQIDLTPDEYIIGAVDIYLDIVNLILWILMGCFHCMQSAISSN